MRLFKLAVVINTVMVRGGNYWMFLSFIPATEVQPSVLEQHQAPTSAAYSLKKSPICWFLYIYDNGTVIRNHLFLQQLKRQLDWLKEKVHFHPNTGAKTLGSSSFGAQTGVFDTASKSFSSHPAEITRWINWCTATLKISTRSFDFITWQENITCAILPIYKLDNNSFIALLAFQWLSSDWVSLIWKTKWHHHHHDFICFACQ